MFHSEGGKEVSPRRWPLLRFVDTKIGHGAGKGAEAIAAETPLSTSEMNNSKFKINQHVNSIGSAHTAPQENRGQ